jgi:hypothetical protein
MEEWERLGLDPRQWVYGQWWECPREGDPTPVRPQPEAPDVSAGSPWWVAMVVLDSGS